MSKIITEAVKTLSNAANVSTGLLHPNDKNKAKELFKILHQKGEVILKGDVVDAALAQGWSAADADELGSLAQQIGEGKTARIDGGPWWAADIYDTIVARA
ncbi:DUF1889 family protein [Cupriavidus taiwanensis]|uniref:Uncharacterized protein n=1 Tax=Cupriavidus taiwanensis TaxID=164546 RepID=A0A7Z7NQ40_9BURK|nr:DUF1889 family protein [Cupriavidus taiwanensis]SOZ17269.1 conserved hypothetical protein [Cupriavidus taiwanensis]SOZ96403.1 conserved hypothetical protein [Cupriavidus taiwanensis]SPC25651.1 conserved hypothetical protein [Cupriavidus taiwanensis]